MDERERPQDADPDPVEGGDAPQDARGLGRSRMGLRGRRFAAAGMLATGLVAGGILAGSHVAGAATNGSSSSGSSAATAAASTSQAPAGDPATMKHGPGETLLTGTTASKVKAAAQAAVPGATVIRVETDSDGSAYEAHMQKSDGSFVTVKVDKNFKATDTISGFGGPGPGHPGSGSGSGTGA